MNKKTLKVLISLALLFVFTSNVNASLRCNSDDEEVTITETGITDAGFDATLPVCKWRRAEGYRPHSGYSSYDAALAAGDSLVIHYVESLDAKSLVGQKVPLCKDPERKVTAKVTCVETVTSTHHYKANDCSSKSQRECTGGCSWNAGDESTPGSCGGNNGYNYYTCPDGFSPSGRLSSSTTCTRTKEYNYDPVTAGQDVVAEAKADFGNGTCTADYTLQCPLYICDRTYKNFSLCTPDFDIAGQPAYCVNPSQPFYQNGESDNYQYDDSFNVFDCASSYSTVDCGYANILIEGAYYNTSDKAINTALRLWSVHSGQTGFDKTGVANLTGEDCKTVTYFTTDENNDYVNVYKQTHDYIMVVAKDKFYDVARLMDHIPPEENGNTRGELNGNTFEAIACLTTSELRNMTKVKKMRGVMCGTEPNADYRVAFELYFNTLIGNQYMKNHLSKLYGGGNGSKPTAATLQSEYSFEESTSSSSVETWVEVTFEHEEFWDEIKDEEVECSDAKLAELRTKLIREGKTASEADAIINQIKPYCQVKVTVTDEDGNVIVDEQDIKKCIKHFGCRTTTFKFAICDIMNNNGKDIEIKVKYQREKSSYSVRKYYSCANANVNQTLFAFFKDDDDSDSGLGEATEVGRDEAVTTFSVTNYKCDGGCNDASLRIEGKDSCENDQNNYNGIYSTKVKDPSLKCIVNLEEPSAKNRYDYSSYFGVNTNFCRVYCSDEAEYVLADKVKAISGRTFMYDIEFPAKNTKELNYKLTSVVKEKRTCLSEIYYSHLYNLDDFKTDYGLTDEEFAKLKQSKTFAGLFNVLKEKYSSENEREEVLNQIIYDIYNCNFYSEKTIKDAGVEIPKNYKTTLISKVKNIYKESNNYGLGSDREGNKTAQTHAYNVKYEFGAINKDNNNRINNVSNTSVFTGKLSSISYCKDRSGNLCYGYDSNNDVASYNYPANRPASKKTYTLFGGKNIDVPTNDYARFTVTSEINYYNNNKYQADYGSGKVVPGNTNSSLLTLPSFSYPIDKNAYNLDACRTSLENGVYHRCVVSQVLNPLSFYRNETAGKLTINENNTFTCYVDVKKPNCDDPSKPTCEEKSAALYRNVDPANLFPSGVKEKSNWSTAKGLIIKEFIEANSNKYSTDNEYLDFSVTINPTQTKNIKEFNALNGSYSDELIYNCEKDSEDGYYYNCHSYFLDILRGNSSEYATGYYGNVNADNKK
jgi:hypothetical protein